MRAQNMKFVIEQAQAQEHPFALAVRQSIEVGVVVPSILRAALAKAGFKVVDDEAKMSEYGFASLTALKRVIVNDKAGNMVAMGAAGDAGEALAHAALGWFRENALPDAEVPQGIASAPK